VHTTFNGAIVIPADSVKSPVLDFCNNGYEPSGSVRRMIFDEISDSHGEEYEDGCILEWALMKEAVTTSAVS
jgi:hypothetical protein